MTIQERSERIEKYIKGVLTGEELEAFESQLRTDPDLASDVALQKDIVRALGEKDVIEFRKKLQAVNDDISRTESAPARVFNLKFILARAAAILLLIAAGYWIVSLFQKEPYSSGQLYSAYFVAPDSIEVPAGFSRDTGEVNPESLQSAELKKWLQAENFYKKGEYARAFDMLNALPGEIKGKYPSDLYFQLGVLALLTDQPEIAVTYFQQVEVTYLSAKEWYTALAFLKMEGQEVAAKKAFEAIANSKNPYQSRAREILDKMD